MFGCSPARSIACISRLVRWRSSSEHGTQSTRQERNAYTQQCLFSSLPASFVFPGLRSKRQMTCQIVLTKNLVMQKDYCCQIFHTIFCLEWFMVVAAYCQPSCLVTFPFLFFVWVLLQCWARQLWNAFVLVTTQHFYASKIYKREWTYKNENKTNTLLNTFSQYVFF